MKKIKLFCAVGMSTSLLVNKMREYASKSNIEVEINAYPIENLKEEIKDCNVVLLGPQVSYLLDDSKKIADEHNVPIAVIPMIDYGMMNGEKVLKFAMDLE